MKMTFQPKKRQRAKVHGFRARMKTTGGRKVIAARRAKGICLIVSSLKQKNYGPQHHVAFSFLTFPEKGECFDNLIVRSFG